MAGNHSSLAIANEFIRRSLCEPVRLVTQMKLQKLVYFAHGWNLAARGVGLVEDQVQAWEYGPVYPKLYAAARNYGRSPIREPILWGADTPFSFDDDGEAFEELLPDDRMIVDFVWETYGGFPAFKLSALTHADGTPWSSTYEHGRNKPIDDESIKEHFNSMLE